MSPVKRELRIIEQTNDIEKLRFFAERYIKLFEEAIEHRDEEDQYQYSVELPPTWALEKCYL